MQPGECHRLTKIIKNASIIDSSALPIAHGNASTVITVMPFRSPMGQRGNGAKHIDADPGISTFYDV